MSASLIQSLGSGTPSLQDEMVRRFAANLAQNPEARAAFEKATGGNTPASSPAALRSLENEQLAAARRANQLAAGREAVAAKKMEQEAFGTRPSGLLQSQVVELPGGGKAVYDREGRLVGTNVPVQVPSDAATKSPGQFMDALDKAAFNRGEGTAAEKAALYPAMEAAVRQARMAKPAAAPGASVFPAASAAPAPAAKPVQEGLLPPIGLPSTSAQEGLLPSIGLPVLEPGLTTDELDAQMAQNREKAIGDLVRERGGFFGAFAKELEKTAQQRAQDMQDAERRAYERAPLGAGLSEEDMRRRSSGAAQTRRAPLPESLAGTGFEEQINEFYAPPRSPESDPFEVPPSVWSWEAAARSLPLLRYLQFPDRARETMFEALEKSR